MMAILQMPAMQTTTDVALAATDERNWLLWTAFKTGQVLLFVLSLALLVAALVLADLQALLLAVDFRVFPEMFEKVFLKPTLVRKSDNELMSDGSVKPILRGRELPDGKVWTPKDLTYLYFVKSSPVEDKHCPHSQSFYVPKSGVISKIYYQLDELLKNKENSVKRMVREKYFLSIYEWTRWSDYFVTDVDDVITILAIRHAFSFTYLTPSERVMSNF